jgi:hypothetical protein
MIIFRKVTLSGMHSTINSDHDQLICVTSNKKCCFSRFKNILHDDCKCSAFILNASGLHTWTMNHVIKELTEESFHLRMNEESGCSSNNKDCCCSRMNKLTSYEKTNE